jgi:hypothetical protein
MSSPPRHPRTCGTLSRRSYPRPPMRARFSSVSSSPLPQKRDLSAADCFGKIKNLATEMAATDAPFRDDEILAYMLVGLPIDYDPYVTSIITKDSITLDDACAHLIAFEPRHLKHQASLQLNIGSSANYVGRGTQSSGHGNPSTGRGRSDRGRGHSRGTAPPRSNGDHRSSLCPPYQICGKVGHTAVRCWHRMDDSYNEDPPSAAMVTTSSKVDADWYTDTGATDHITSDLDRLTFHERYHGNNQVQASNGSGL